MLATRLSILIPVYNEASSVAAVLDRVVAASASYFEAEKIHADLIVVDDGSRDESYLAVQEFSRARPEVCLKLIRHETNRGKGAAIRTAISHAQGDFCIIQDADFEYDPADYPRILQPLLSGDADVVLGSRVLNTALRRPFGFWQAFANRAITTFAGLAAGLDLSDVETGYKAFRTSLAQTVPLKSDHFGLDPELIIQFAKRHARVIEVPISYHGRGRDEGKKIGVRDGFAAFGAILRSWLFSAAYTDPAADMLVAMSRAKRFNRWMADTIGPWIVGEVLELGAGIGNLTVLLSSGRHRYIATDTHKEHLYELRSRVDHRPNVELAVCDFSDPADAERFRESADTVVCLNVLEHVADDLAGLENIHACLRPGGTAIILVPQGPQAFGSMDEVLEHKRRYTVEELKGKMAAAGFQVEQITFFNRATWPGWYLNSRILRRRTLSRLQLRVFDLLVPVWRRIDSRLPWPATSLIAIGIAAH
ncbi:MAG: glycosyltransferase [Acidobacteriaceae bacterium]|nr:glycosyltransferase [Acidobacteriaceae bacterium]